MKIAIFGIGAMGSVYAGLFAEAGENRTGLAVETALGVVVTDIANRFTHQGFHIHFGVGGDFTGEHDHAGLDQGFAGNP